MFLRKGRFQPSGWESPMEEHGQWAHLAVRAKVLDTTFGPFGDQISGCRSSRPVLGQFNYHKSPKPQRWGLQLPSLPSRDRAGSFSLFASDHSVASEDADASDGQQPDLMAVLEKLHSASDRPKPQSQMPLTVRIKKASEYPGNQPQCQHQEGLVTSAIGAFVSRCCLMSCLHRHQWLQEQQNNHWHALTILRLKSYLHSFLGGKIWVVSTEVDPLLRQTRISDRCSHAHSVNLPFMVGQYRSNFRSFWGVPKFQTKPLCSYHVSHVHLIYIYV